MDGYAVRSEETRGASETSPLLLRVGEQAIPVDTGDPLPLGMNAVIMIENTQPVWQEGVDYIEILSAVAPWADVRPMGEDMVATELVLPANHRLRPQDVGAIAGSGHTQVTVYRRPRVAILPTGTELVKPGSALQPGDIIEYNSLMLGAQAEEAGCVVTRLPIQADDYASIKAAVVDALETHDLVAINAGSSAGSRRLHLDHRCANWANCASTASPSGPGIRSCWVWRKARALSRRTRLPVSAAMTFERIVMPVLYRWQGLQPPERRASTPR